MKIPLKKTLAAFSVGLSALPVIVIGLLVLMMNSDIREIVNSEFDKIGARATRQIVTGYGHLERHCPGIGKQIQDYR